MAGVLPDTSLLVAAFCDWHEHHAIAAPPLAAARRAGKIVLAGPVLAEAYAVLTRLPAPHRLSPASAHDLLAANLSDARIITLDGKAHWTCLTTAVERHVAGGRTYDAIVVACAVRARVDRILTLNRRDFERLALPPLVVECPLG